MKKSLMCGVLALCAGGIVRAQAPKNPQLGATPQGGMVAAESKTIEGKVVVKTDDAGNIVEVAFVPATGEPMPVRLNEKGKQLAELKDRTVKAGGIVARGAMFVASFEEIKAGSAPSSEEKE